MKIDGEIKEAMDVLYKINVDKEAIMLAEMREKAIILNANINIKNMTLELEK